MKNLLNKFIKITYTNKHTIYQISKIKIKVKRKINMCVTLDDLRAYSLASKFHPNLEKYRGIYTGKSVVVVGGGATVKYYKNPMPDAVHIGVNRAYELKHINFDYLFAQDNFPNKENIEEFINYRPDTCIKFLGLHSRNMNFRIRPSTIARIKNKEIYVLNCRRPKKTFYPIDITAEPFVYFCGTIFAVLQFLLLTNAEKIYLVGFDCNVSHAFTSNLKEQDLRIQYPYWYQFTQYKNMYFENTRIISVNPVALKGLFKDIYTQNYIDEHPELSYKL